MPDLDLPLNPTPEQIRRKEFGSIRRGYDPDEVNDYLYALAERIETLEGDLRETRAAVENAARTAPAEPVAEATPALDPYEAFAKRFAGLLGTADQEAERLVADAQAESVRILEEARVDADRIREDAQSRADDSSAEADRMLARARTEAERALTGLASRRQELADQLQTMQARLLSAAKDLDMVIDDPAELPEPIAEAEARAISSSAEIPARADDPSATSGDADSDSDSDSDSLGIEELWVAKDDAMDLPDLASIEFDFDADDRPND
jgi:DivIVA domain-containing protein